jgi:hypothetical protein
MPEYLRRSFGYSDQSDARRAARQILAGSYDYKADDERIHQLMETTRTWVKPGGPVSSRALHGYPGDSEYIKHLEATSSFKYQEPSLYHTNRALYLYQELLKKRGINSSYGSEGGESEQDESESDNHYEDINEENTTKQERSQEGNDEVNMSSPRN